MAHEMTHEEYIAEVAAFALNRLPPELRERAAGTKLVYGAGASGLRGVTYYDAWQNGADECAPFVEICAFGEESPCQLAGTTIHELAHTITRGDGHGKLWREACGALGLRRARAAGHRYMMAGFEPDVRAFLAGLPRPVEGNPRPLMNLSGKLLKPRVCKAGHGTRGGKSRGPGSGSRLRRWVCNCDRPVILRVARDDLDVTCNVCASEFKRSDG